MMEELVVSSGMDSRISVEQEETSNLMAMESKRSEWTNEKHSMHLKSMEATFVNQLYKSIDLFGWRSQNNFPSGSKSFEQKETSIGSPCGQFKIFRNGGWSNVDFRRDEPPEVDQDEQSVALLANPWIQHYRCSGRKAIRISPSSRAKAPFAHLAPMVNQSPAHHFRLWRQDSESCNTEVTDQNFNNEDLEEDKKTGTPHEMKRMKTSTDTILCNDQVVPLTNIVKVNDVAENHVPPKD